MLTLRPSRDRGHADLKWLDSRHSFSFADYYDPEHMGFRSLRVINEDRVGPGGGFSKHAHRDWEIISYVLEGALEHRDSLGTGSVIHPGEIQRVSAGTGILHSEDNPSLSEPVHFLQIWLVPEVKGLPPSYAQQAFSPESAQGKLLLLASRDGREGSVTIHTDASLYLARLGPEETVEHLLAPGRGAWIQVTRGTIELNGTELSEGDGAAIEQEHLVSLRGNTASELLLFDLG